MTRLRDLLRRAREQLDKVVLAVAMVCAMVLMLGLDWCSGLIGGP